jgi:hypothetical protein
MIRLPAQQGDLAWRVRAHVRPDDGAHQFGATHQ